MNALQEFLRSKGIPFSEGGSHKHVRYGWTGLQCPWCMTDKWHLGVRDADGFTTCWRCGTHRLGDSLMMISGLSWGDVKEVVQHTTKYRSVAKLEIDRPSTVALPDGIGPLNKPQLQYVKSRGFDPEYLLETWGVQGIGLAPPLSWRLFIPIVLRGRVVSWTTRGIGPRGIRYVTAKPDQESMSSNDVLYGCDLAGHSIVVVEGPADAWAIGPGAVAVLGLNLSEVQLREIGAYPVRSICFDKGSTAQRQADRVAEKLRDLPGDTNIIEIESGDDPADMDEDEIVELRRRFLTK